jgi:hypothetical protein
MRFILLHLLLCILSIKQLYLAFYKQRKQSSKFKYIEECVCCLPPAEGSNAPCEAEAADEHQAMLEAAFPCPLLTQNLWVAR